MNEEKIMRDAIIKAYITVYGIEKWNSLTDDQKDSVLHIVLNDFAKLILN